MSGILLSLGIAIVPFLLQGVPLFRARRLKEAFLYTGLMGLGCWFSVYTFNLVTTPSPLLLIKAIFGPIAKVLGLDS